jgi:hypothetical protein
VSLHPTGRLKGSPTLIPWNAPATVSSLNLASRAGPEACIAAVVYLIGRDVTRFSCKHRICLQLEHFCSSGALHRVGYSKTSYNSTEMIHPS